MSAYGRQRGLTLGRGIRIGILLAILGALSEILALLLAMTSADQGLQPPPDDVARLAIDAGGLKRTEFLTEDKILIRAEQLGSFDERPIVVVGHGFRRSRRQGDELARALLREGYAVLLFDFRASGESTGKYTTFGATEGADIAAAVGYLENVLAIPRGHCAFVGFSMGAAAALLRPDAVRDMAAVVAVAPYARLDHSMSARTQRFTLLPLDPWYRPATWAFRKVLGFDVADVAPIDHVASIAPTPLLLLGGDRDWRAPPQELYALFDAAKEPCEVEILKGHDHSALEDWPADLVERIVEFLRRRLPIEDGDR